MADDDNPRPSGQRRRFDLVAAQLRHNFREAVGDLVGLAVLGLLALLLNQLRWWTIAVAPGLYATIVLFKKRANFLAAFSSSAQAAGYHRDLVLIRLHFFILTLVFAGVAVATRASVYVCLVASAFSVATLLSFKAGMESASQTKRFAYYLVKGSLEFLIILTATLAAYSIYAWRISQLPLNTTTLLQVRSWERSIEEIRDRLENWNPSKLSTMLLVAALFAARVVAIRWGHGKRVVSRAWALSQFGLRWMNRATLAAAMAASFTFLATRPEGPPAPPRAQLKRTDKDYSDFRSQVESALETETKRQLVNRAWSEMPSPLREALRRVETVEEEKVELLKEIRWAENRYGLGGTPSAARAQEYAMQFDRSAPAEQSSPITLGPDQRGVDSLTANDLHDVVAGMSEARSEVAKQPDDEKEEMGEELAKSVQAFVTDPGGLIHLVGKVGLRTEGAAKLGQLATSNPLLGSVFDMLSDTLNDYAYDQLRAGVDALTRELLTSRGKPALTEIKRVASEIASGVQLHWRANDQAWRSEIGRQVRTQELGLREAQRQLQTDAAFAEERDITKLVAEVRQHETEFEEIGNTVPEHKDLVANMEAQVRQLESRASGENPLSGFANSVKADAAREAALRRYFKTQPSDAPAALRAFNEELQALDRAWPATAFDRLTRLNRSGALEVQAIVGESPDLVRVRLQEALGKDVFDRYERDYQAERAELTTDMLITARSKGIRGAEPFEERPIEQKPEIRPEPRPIEIP